jgi:hypothetical protein
MHLRKWLVVALAVLALSAGCSNFNTNLTTQTTSSILSFLSPATVAAGSPGFTLHVYGTGFVNTAIVRWNGSDRTTTFVDSTHLTAAITASDVATAETAQVVVSIPGSAVAGTSGVNSTGTTELSNVANFTVSFNLRALARAAPISL